MHKQTERTCSMRQYEFYKTGSLIMLLWSFVMILGFVNIEELAYAHPAGKDEALAKEEVMKARNELDQEIKERRGEVQLQEKHTARHSFTKPWPYIC